CLVAVQRSVRQRDAATGVVNAAAPGGAALTPVAAVGARLADGAVRPVDARRAVSARRQVGGNIAIVQRQGRAGGVIDAATLGVRALATVSPDHLIAVDADVGQGESARVPKAAALTGEAVLNRQAGKRDRVSA